MAQPVRRTLIVTNDFPPRQGGIQSFVHSLAIRQPAESLVVYTSSHVGASEFDAQLAFPVIRDRRTMLLPTPRVSAAVTAAARDFGATAVWFGAAAPLGLLAPALRQAGVQNLVATTHGHEVGWATLPVARQMLRRIGNHCDVVTYLGDYTKRRLVGAFGDHPRLEQLAPGVDIETFHPLIEQSKVDELRTRYGLQDRSVVVCVSRLVPRKGQDVLIRAIGRVGEPDSVLLIVGSGKYSNHLRKLARREGLVEREGVADRVVFTGSVAYDELPAHFALGDVFAMPCRTRRLGMDVEGLGIVFLEASAMGLPVVAGDSGGAPDAVLEGQTGFVVDGRDVDVVAERISTLLASRTLADSMGAAGRQWVIDNWQWDTAAARLRALLDQTF